MIEKAKKTLNNDGSSLVWVAVSLVVLLILIGGILTMATVYHGSSVNSNALNQAYFSARSSADSVVAELQKNPTGDLAAKIGDLSPGDSLPLGEVSFGDNKDMGSCTLSLYKTDDKTAYVKADATVGKVTDTVVALLGKQTINNSTRPTLPDYVYIGSNSSGEDRITFDSLTGLYLAPAQGAFTIQGDNKTDPKITEDIYSQRPLIINGFSTPNGRVSVTGNIISTESITITRYVTVGGDIISHKNISFDSNGSKMIVTKGNIKGDNVVITGGTDIEAKGVEAVTLTLEGNNSSFTGSVSAGSVTLNQGCSITGDVKCDILTINGNGKTTPVQGNVSFRTVNINNTEYPTLEALNQAFPNDGWKQYFTGSVSFIRSHQVSAPTQKVPAGNPPGFGSATDLEAAMISYFNGTLGTTDGNDSYYVLGAPGEQTGYEGNITVQGSGNIFVYLTDGAELKIEGITYNDTYNKEKPTLYIVAKGDCELEFASRVSEFFGYIYAQMGDDGKLPELDIDAPITINGGVFYDNLDDDSDDFFNGNLTVNSISATGFDDNPGAGSEGGSSRQQWYVRQYLNSLPNELEG